MLLRDCDHEIVSWDCCCSVVTLKVVIHEELGAPSASAPEQRVRVDNVSMRFL